MIIKESKEKINPCPDDFLVQKVKLNIHTESYCRPHDDTENADTDAIVIRSKVTT